MSKAREILNETEEYSGWVHIDDMHTGDGWEWGVVAPNLEKAVEIVCTVKGWKLLKQAVDTAFYVVNPELFGDYISDIEWLELLQELRDDLQSCIDGGGDYPGLLAIYDAADAVEDDDNE